MRIKDVYANGFGLSFEIFPPKSEQGDVSLVEHLEKLVAYAPAFISCTFGAGGSTKLRTIELCRWIQERWQIPVTAHLTCVGANQSELQEWLQNAERVGIRNIMALRGDPPVGQTEFQVVEGGLRYANELVRFIRDRFTDFGIGVDYTIRQCQQLLETEVPGMHFYVMNRSEAMLHVLKHILPLFLLMT